MAVNWKTGGLLLGLVFFIAVLLVKPIGVSTQFVVLDGVIWNAIDPGLITLGADGAPASANPYVEKNAGEILQPINYEFVFVLAMILGAGISVAMSGGFAATEREVPELWAVNHGRDRGKRLLVAFASGAVVLFGARLAGGCTSGNMMSGMGQTALSGYIFTLGAFAAAIPTALMLYRRDTNA